MIEEPSGPAVGKLELRSYSRHGVRVLIVAGDLDIAVRGAWKAALFEALATARVGLVVDMSSVRFCDAGSTGLLAAAARHDRKRRRVAVAAPRRAVTRVLDILVSPSVVPRYPTVTEAVAKLAKQHRKWGCA